MTNRIIRRRRRRKKKSAKPTQTQIDTRGFSVDSSGKFVSGMFYSDKNKKNMPYRSSYEFAYYNILDNDDDVIEYVVEPISITYKHPYTKKDKEYIPDLIILYKDDIYKMVEIKPYSMMRNPVVLAKARAARRKLSKLSVNMTYHFITERDIFKNKKDYIRLVKLMKE